MAFEEEENIQRYDHLVELNDSDYEIADDEPNIEGWEVKDGEGAVIGEVNDLLFDPQSRKVRYMIVELDEDYYTENNAVIVENDVVMDSDTDTDDDERIVLIPIGIAELVVDDQEVFLPGVTAYQLKALPLYEKDQLIPANEATIRNIFEGTTNEGMVVADQYNRDDFYYHDHFNDDKFYNRQTTLTEIEPNGYNDELTKDEEPNVIAEDPWYNGEEHSKNVDLGKTPEKGNDSTPVI